MRKLFSIIIGLTLFASNAFCADRYWNPASDPANYEDTSSWSASDGGATGETVPNLNSNVYFTATNTNDCLIVNSSAVAHDLDTTGYTGDLGGDQAVAIYGNLTLGASTTVSNTGQWYARRTSAGGTITTNGVDMSSIASFRPCWSDGGEYTLQDDFDMGSGGNVYACNGDNTKFYLNGNTITTGGWFTSAYSTTRTIDLTNGTLNVAGLNFDGATNMTFVGTGSTINTNNIFYGNGETFNDVNLSPTSAKSITGENTFNDLTFTGSGNITLSDQQTVLGDFDATSYTGDLGGSGRLLMYGDCTLGSGMTVSATEQFRFISSGATTHNITTNGVDLSSLTAMYFYSGTSDYVLQDAVNLGTTANFTLRAGDLDTNDQTVTCKTFSSDNTNTRSIDLGASTINSVSLEWQDTTNLSFTAGTSTINVDNSVFRVANAGGSGQTFNDVSIVAGNASMLGSNTFANLEITGGGYRQLSDDQTVTGTFTINGLSIANRAEIKSDTPATARTITVNTDVDNMEYADNAEIQSAYTASHSSDNAEIDTGDYQEGTRSGKFPFTYDELDTLAKWVGAISSVDLSDTTGVSSGNPTQGTLGFWYKASGDVFTNLNLRIGSDGSNYLQYLSNVDKSAGWHYIEADLTSDVTVTGTPDWTDVDFVQIQLSAVNNDGYILLDGIGVGATDLSNVDLTDITGAGTASWTCARTAGCRDKGGNTGIDWSTNIDEIGGVYWSDIGSIAGLDIAYVGSIGGVE